jgi:hypothetical protein
MKHFKGQVTQGLSGSLLINNSCGPSSENNMYFDGPLNFHYAIKRCQHPMVMVLVFYV